MNVNFNEILKNSNIKPSDFMRLVANMKLLEVLIDKAIAEAVNEWTLEKDIEGKSKKTLRFYRDNMKGFVAFVGPETSVKNIQPRRVNEYLQGRRITGARPHTLHATHRTLTVFFNWCKRQNYCTESPVKVNRPNVPVKVKKVLSEKDFLVLLKSCGESGRMAKRDRAIFMLLWDTGMRLGEMANMKLEDIDLNNHRIKILGKGQKERVVRTSSAVTRAVYDYIKMRQSTYPAVWLSEEGRPLTDSGVQQIIRRVSMRALGRVLGPHIFRHTFASNFLMDGGDSIDLKYILGHNSLRMVMHYSEATKKQRALQAQAKHSPIEKLGLR